MAIVTISRATMSGGAELARMLEKRLGYKCMGREVLTACARKYGIPEEDLYHKLTEAPSLWQRMTREHQHYLIYIKCALIEAARQDNVIYHGYAGQLYLGGTHHVLKMRLETPHDKRVQAMVRESGGTEQQASKRLANADGERERWVKFLYDKDWHDPSLYDITVNLDNMTPETVCDVVALLVVSPEFATTEQSAKRLDDLWLESEVKAALTSHESLWNLPITVTANDGAIALCGLVKNRTLRDLIVETASRVSGVTECQVHISLSGDALSHGKFGRD